MDKYKLIKEYPGSPKLGLIIDNYVYTKGAETINIKNEKEFWEEIIEKDYKILSYKGICGDIYELQSSGLYKQNNTINHIVDFKRYFIHSIKRLSDDEIFTIGDNIKGWVGDEEGFKINYIYLSNEDLCFATYLKNDSLMSGRSCYLSKNYPIKIKAPLFTTEDGVDIFEGDQVYTVTNLQLIPLKWWKSYGNQGTPLDGNKYYASKEKAEKYILYNKPILSLENVLDIWSGLPLGPTKESLKVDSTLIRKLTEFTKNKLNK